MPKRIHLAERKGLLDDGPQLIDVLAPSEYAEEHLPGAINIPRQACPAFGLVAGRDVR
jgi:rhodanese-related sulfurtransferase